MDFRLTNLQIVGMLAITPSDTVNVDSRYAEGIYVSVAGNVAVELKDGTSFSFTGLAAGDTLNVRFNKVKATGTTATVVGCRIN